MFERADVTIQEHLLGLVQIGDRERPTRRRQPHHEHRDLGEHTAQTDVNRSEVDLALLTQRVMLRDRDVDQRSLLAFPNDLDIAAHSRLAQIGVVFVNEALPHPPGGVALLAWQRPIRFQPGVDDCFELVHLRRRPLGRLAWCRHRRFQRSSHVTAMHPEAHSKRPDRQLLAFMHTADLFVELHLRPLRHGHTTAATDQPAADPNIERPSGAKSDEHYNSK